jgi:hypothetical protein
MVSASADWAIVGGLVGVLSGGTIIRSYATGTVGATYYAGGLVGHVGLGTITDSYAKGAVSGIGNNARVGGLVGYLNTGTITDSYATGAVSGDYIVGGLVGNTYQETVTSSYWLKTETVNSTLPDNGNQRNLAQMTTVPRPVDTFVDWDFTSTWKQTNGSYPKLAWE